MLLYATTTSERASKGQGGNEYLIIEILDEDKKSIADFIFYPKNKDGIISMSLWTGGSVIRSEKQKGKSQKGEQFEPRCTKCRSTMTDTGDEWVCDNESCGYNLIKPN